jgi:peptide/nickel transport system substrate-binding protein
MDYKPGTTELMPDLAESHTISDDGLTYTSLRPNLNSTTAAPSRRPM